MRPSLIWCACCLVSASLFAVSLPVAKPEQAGMSTERLKRLSAAMRGYIDRGEAAGTVTAVARRGRLVHLEAQGLLDIDSHAPMRADSIFRLASMTKPITSVAVMILLEEGRFVLTDPVSKLIPEFKDPKVLVVNPPGTSRAASKLVPAEREITIRDLLTHTSGLATGAAAAAGASPNDTIGADTHTALWHLFDDARLSAAAGAFITEAATARRKIAISTISLAEVVYLIEKNRLPPSAYEELTQALADPEHVF